MQLNEFEKHIASNINDYQSKIDTGSLWDTLEADLDQKKKKRRGIILLITLVSLFTIGYLGWSSYFGESYEDSNSTSISVEEAIPSKSEQSLVDPLLNENEKSNIIVNENSEAIKNTSTKEVAVKATTSSRKTKTTTSKTSSVSIKSAITADVQLSPISEVVKSQQVTSSKFTNQLSVPSSHLDRQSAFNNIEQDSQQKLTSNINSVDTQGKNLKSLYQLDFIQVDLLEWEKTKVILEKRPSSLPVKQWRMSVSPQFGIYYTDRTIITNNFNGENLIDYRNNSEQALETMSVGLGAELQHKSNFYISGGAHLKQLTERFNGQTNQVNIESIQYIQEKNFLANGVVEEISGTFDQRQETIRTVNNFNTLRWVELTIGGGYRFTKNRWQLGAGTGLMWGTMFNVKGKIFDVNRNIVNIENQLSNIYKSDLGLGGFVHLDLRYILNNRVSLSTQLGSKFYANSFTESSYPLDINYQWWGGTVGLSYHIF